MQKLKLVQTLFERGLPVSGVLFAPDGSTLATAGGYRGNAIRFWDSASWTPRGSLQGHKKSPMCLAFGGSARLLVSGAFDKEVKAWDCGELRQAAAHMSHRHAVTAVACDAEAARIVSGDKDGCVFSWTTGDHRSPVLFATIDGRVNSLAFSPGGHILASGGGIERQLSKVHIWDSESGSLIKKLDGHSDWVLWVGFSKDGATLGTGSYGETCLWDTESWELLQVLRPPDTEKFSTIAFSFFSGKNVFISGAWSHEEVRHEVRDTSGDILGWNVTHKGLVVFWDLTSGTLSDCIKAHKDSLRCLSYSQNKDLLATGGADGVVKIWSVSP
jgi:WD40 repeat protein